MVAATQSERVVKVIWCQGGNPRSARLAIEAGWHYGFRSDDNHFADTLGPVALAGLPLREGILTGNSAP